MKTAGILELVSGKDWGEKKGEDRRKLKKKKEEKKMKLIFDIVTLFVQTIQCSFNNIKINRKLIIIVTVLVHFLPLLREKERKRTVGRARKRMKKGLQWWCW